MLLKWAFIFLGVAIIAAIFGFTGIAQASVGIARLFFLIFFVLFIIALLFSLSLFG